MRGPPRRSSDQRRPLARRCWSRESPRASGFFDRRVSGAGGCRCPFVRRRRSARFAFGSSAFGFSAMLPPPSRSPARARHPPKPVGTVASRQQPTAQPVRVLLRKDDPVEVSATPNPPNFLRQRQKVASATPSLRQIASTEVPAPPGAERSRSARSCTASARALLSRSGAASRKIHMASGSRSGGKTNEAWAARTDVAHLDTRSRALGFRRRSRPSDRSPQGMLGGRSVHDRGPIG